MPREIDDRVLAMEFDNSRFEKNVDTSISTLGRLKDALSFQGTDKDFSIAETAVYQLGKSFNWLEEIGIGALRRFGSAISDWAVNTVKNLSGVNNAIAGFQKFGEMTESTGTLKAQGYELEEINTQLDRLNWFSDETSYNLTDMVSNLAKFTATGQGLEDSADAVMGIALWAALSGKNASQASSAMYQLSQALGAGVMRKEDWKSIQNLNMNTREFQQHALDAAVALKTLKKNSDGTYTSLVATGKAGKEAFNIDQFAERLTEGGWFTKDVMMKVFREYSAGVQQIYDYTEEHGVIASKAIEELEGEVDEFGMKAFKAGQEARTWGAVVDSIKDAASTGWMTVYQNLFGEYDAVVKFFTDLANRFYDIFVEPINTFNIVLERWGQSSGQHDFINTIYNLISAIENVGEVFSEVFDDVVYGTNDEEEILDRNTNALIKITWYAKKYSLQLADTIQESSTFKKYLRGLITVFDVAWQVLSQFHEAAKETFSGIWTIIQKLVERFSNISEAFYNFGKQTKANKTFYKIFVTALKPLQNLKKYIQDLYAELLPNLSKRWSSLKNAFQEKISPSIDRLASAFKKLFSIVTNVWKGLFGGLDANKTADRLFEAWDKIKDSFYSITGLEPGTFLDLIAQNIDKVSGKLENLYSWLTVKDVKTGLTGIEKIQNAFDSAIKWIKDTFSPIWEDVKTAFGNVFKWIIENWDDIWGTVKQIGLAIWSFLSGLWASVSGIFAKKDGEEAGESIFTGLLDSLKTLGSLLGTVLTSILSSISPLVENITGTLGSLSFDNAGEFLRGGGLALLGAGFYQWSKNLKKSNWILGFGDLLESLAGPLDSFAHLLDGKALKEAAIGIGILVGALLLLISMPQDNLVSAAITMGLIIDVLTKSLKKLSVFNTKATIDKNGFNFTKTGAGSTILMLALSMIAIAYALRIIAKIPEDDLYRAAFVVSVIIFIIGSIIKGVSRIQNAGDKTKVTNSGNTTLNLTAKTGLAGTLIALAAFIAVVVLALKKITEMVKNEKNGEFTKALIVVAGIMVALGVFLVAVGKLTQQSKDGDHIKAMDKGLWIAILALGGAIYLIALAFEKIANTGATKSRMLGAGALILLIMTIMTAFAYAASKSSASASKIAGISLSLLMFSFAIGIIAGIYAVLAKVLDTVKNPENARHAFELISVLLLGFTLLFATKASANLDPKKMVKGASALILVSVALAIAAGSMLLLSRIPAKKMEGVLALFTVLTLAVISLGLLSSGPMGDGLVKLSTAIILIAGAAALLGVGFLAAAEAIKIFSDSEIDVKRAVENISQFIDQMLEKLPTWVEKIIQTILEVALAAIPATVKAFINTVSETLASLVEEDPLTGKMKIDTLIDNGIKVVLAICNGITARSEEIITSIGDMLLGLFSSLNNWLITNADTIGQVLSDGLQALFEVVVSAFDNIGEAIFGEEDWITVRGLLIEIKDWLENNLFTWLWDRFIGILDWCNTLIGSLGAVFGIESEAMTRIQGMSSWYDYFKKIAPDARNWDIWKAASENVKAGITIDENGNVYAPRTGYGTHYGPGGAYGGHGGKFAISIDSDGMMIGSGNISSKDVDVETGKTIIGSTSELQIYDPIHIRQASLVIDGGNIDLGSWIYPGLSGSDESRSIYNSITIHNPPGKTAAEQYRQAKVGLAQITAYEK